MAITNGYCSLAEYKAYISMRGLSGAVGTDASDDAVIEDMVENVSRYIARQTGRRFYVDGSDTDYFYKVDDSYEIPLPDFASITTVSVDYNNTRSYTALVSGDYDKLPDNYVAEGLPINGLAITPTSSAYFPTWRRGVKVTGKRGWSAVPADIKDACLAIVENIYSARSGQTSAGRVSITASGVVIKPQDVPDFAQMTIKNYRIMT